MNNKPSLKVAALLSAAIAIVGSILLAKCAYANTITDQFRIENNAGTLFPNDLSLDGWRACTEKDIQFFNVREDVERTTAYFIETGICRGRAERFIGVMMIWSRDGRITGAQWAPIAPAVFDLAVAGQLADVGSTAIGLAAGLTEANPIGLIALPVKYVGLRWSKTLDLHDCVAARSILSSFGWGAAAANLLTIGGAAFPPAMAIGAVAGIVAYGPTKADAPARCIDAEAL